MHVLSYLALFSFRPLPTSLMSLPRLCSVPLSRLALPICHFVPPAPLIYPFFLPKLKRAPTSPYFYLCNPSTLDIYPSSSKTRTLAPSLHLALSSYQSLRPRRQETPNPMYQYYSPSFVSEKPSSASTLYARPMMSTVSSPTGSTSSSGVAQRSSTWQDRLQGSQTLLPLLMQSHGSKGAPAHGILLSEP